MANCVGLADNHVDPEPIRDSLRDILKDAIVSYTGPLPRNESELKGAFFRLIEDGFARARESGADDDIDRLIASEALADMLFRLKDLVSTRLHIHALLLCLGKISDSEEAVARQLGVTKAAVSKSKILIQQYFNLPCRVGRTAGARSKFSAIALNRASRRQTQWTGQKYFARL